MMTEADAKQRWCPFARSPISDDDGAAAVNRKLRGDPDLGCLCLASGCMAWRWYGDDLGYCGLAGPVSD
jgi:hypothetical protein